MRVWETRFQVYDAIDALPIPSVVVEELQGSPSYRFLGKNRKNDQGVQLVYTLSGEGRFFVDGSEYVLSPGKAFLAQHCDERTAYYYPPNGKVPWCFLWIAFYGAYSGDVVNSIVRRYGYIYDLPADKGIIPDIAAFKNLRGTIVKLSPIAGAKLFTDVINGLEIAINPKWNSSSLSLIHNAQSIIMKKLSDDYGVQNLASDLSMSREHLSRLFKKHTGLTVEFYIRREKIRSACMMLKETQLDVKEVSERVGYRSSATFCRAFKKLLKISPEQFRKLGHYPDSI